MFGCFVFVPDSSVRLDLHFPFDLILLLPEFLLLQKFDFEEESYSISQQSIDLVVGHCLSHWSYFVSVALLQSG